MLIYLIIYISQSFLLSQNCLNGWNRSKLHIILLSYSTNDCLQGLHLTSHGAESKLLVSVIVPCGSTPFHVVPPALGRTVGVVSVVVQEGKVAQGTIGISTSSLNQNCPEQHANRKKKITTELSNVQRGITTESFWESPVSATNSQSVSE